MRDCKPRSVGADAAQLLESCAAKFPECLAATSTTPQCKTEERKHRGAGGQVTFRGEKTCQTTCSTSTPPKIAEEPSVPKSRPPRECGLVSTSPNVAPNGRV